MLTSKMSDVHASPHDSSSSNALWLLNLSDISLDNGSLAIPINWKSVNSAFFRTLASCAILQGQDAAKMWNSPVSTL